MSFPIEIVETAIGAGASAGLGVLTEVLKSIFRSPLKTTIIRLKGEPPRIEIKSISPDDVSQTLSMERGDGDTANLDKRAPANVPSTPKYSPKIQRAKTRDAAPNLGLPVASHFKLVFLSVFFLTIACVAVALAISFTHETLNTNQQKVFDTLMWAFTAGCGACFGLLGGKALH